MKFTVLSPDGIPIAPEQIQLAGRKCRCTCRMVQKIQVSRLLRRRGRADSTGGAAVAVRDR